MFLFSKQDKRQDKVRQTDGGANGRTFTPDILPKLAAAIVKASNAQFQIFARTFLIGDGITHAPHGLAHRVQSRAGRRRVALLLLARYLLGLWHPDETGVSPASRCQQKNQEGRQQGCITVHHVPHSFARVSGSCSLPDGCLTYLVLFVRSKRSLSQSKEK